MKNESKPKKKADKKPRSQRFDSVTAQAEIAADAAKKILPPATIRMDEHDLLFFESVIDEFPNAVWTKHMLEVAAMLARTMRQMEHEQYMLGLEGAVAKSDKGTPVVNPRKTVVQMHAGTLLSMRRNLGLHARAQAGEARDQGKRNKAQKNLEDAVKKSFEDDDDDLIARPSMN